MKKFTKIAFAALLFFSKANAQQGFSLSVKAVPQFSFMENKTDKDNAAHSNKATFNAGFGIGADYMVSKNSGIGLDVLYSLQGQRYALNGVEYNQKNDYIKVPVYFTYISDPAKAVSFIGKIGPQVSFITSSSMDDKDGNKLAGDTKNRYKSATFGGAISAGAQFKLNNKLALTTAFKFDCDFTNAEDDTYYAYTPGRAKTYNMATGLEVGLRYQLR
jgi:outer membrane protein W